MEKRGLGRGLAALISDTMLEPAGEALVREVPVAQIVANPMQPRTLFDPIKLEELANSIREHGVLQPVLLKRVGHDRYQLLAGERRFRAATTAGLTSIPAVVKECSDTQQLEIAMVENLQREDIGAMEAARAYQRMSVEFNMTQEAIARRIGKSRTAVTNTMGLLDLPVAVQDSLELGQISEGHARALKGLKSSEAILQAWLMVLRKEMSVRDAERMVRDLRNGISSNKGISPTASAEIQQPGEESFHSDDPNVAHLANRLQEMLKTKVTIKRASNGAGRLEIEFYSDEDLERIFETFIPF